MVWRVCSLEHEVKRESGCLDPEGEEEGEGERYIYIYIERERERTMNKRYLNRETEGCDHARFSEVILSCRVCEALWGPEQMNGAI